VDSSQESNRVCVVSAGDRYRGKQGVDYAPGVSAESVGAKALWLGSVTLPPAAALKRTSTSSTNPRSTWSAGKRWSSGRARNSSTGPSPASATTSTSRPACPTSRSTAPQRRHSWSGLGPTRTSRKAWCCDQTSMRGSRRSPPTGLTRGTINSPRSVLASRSEEFQADQGTGEVEQALDEVGASLVAHPEATKAE
jgi:hypothetical protein